MTELLLDAKDIKKLEKQVEAIVCGTFSEKSAKAVVKFIKKVTEGLTKQGFTRKEVIMIIGSMQGLFPQLLEENTEVSMHG